MKKFAVILVTLITYTNVVRAESATMISQDMRFVQSTLGLHLGNHTNGGAEIIHISLHALRPRLELGDRIIEVDGTQIKNATHAYRVLARSHHELRIMGLNGDSFYTYLDVFDTNEQMTLKDYWVSDRGSLLDLTLISGNCAETGGSEEYTYLMTLRNSYTLSGSLRFDCEGTSVLIEAQRGGQFQGRLNDGQSVMTWLDVDFGRFGKGDIIWR